MAKLRPQMAKMRPKMTKMRPKMAKDRTGTFSSEEDAPPHAGRQSAVCFGLWPNTHYCCSTSAPETTLSHPQAGQR